jgi:hypothetical protein
MSCSVKWGTSVTVHWNSNALGLSGGTAMVRLVSGTLNSMVEKCVPLNFLCANSTGLKTENKLELYHHDGGREGNQETGRKFYHQIEPLLSSRRSL